MDVTGTLSPAWDRTKRVLFQPFEFNKWLSFGVIFFLQSLVEGGGNFSSFNPSRSSSRSRGTFGVGNLKDVVDGARKWLSDNAGVVILAGVVCAVVVLGLALLFTWLGTRGQMMSIRAVSTGRAAIGEHWRETRKAGWDLFKVQIVLGIVAAFFWMPLVILALYRFVDLVDAGVTDEGAYVLAMVPFVVVGFVLAIVFGLVQGILRNFVAPVMLRFDLSAGGAWARFRAVAPGSGGAILVFFLIRIALGIGAALVATVVILCTCCIGALPVLHQAAMAPWYFFERAYGLYALESIGPDMKMLEPLPEVTRPYPPGGFEPKPPTGYSSWGQS